MSALKKSLAIAALCLVAWSAESAEWAMRWRVYFDGVRGVSFRYPYDYMCPNQYQGGLCRGRSMQLDNEAIKKAIESNTSGQPIDLSEFMKKSLLDVKVFSMSASELPSEVKGGTLEQIGNFFAHDDALAVKEDIDWTSYDYYKPSPKRPFADKAWAEAGIEARIGEGSKSCGIIAKHGEEYSALILTGKFSESDNQEMLDTFEIMSGGKTAKAKSTWREAQGKKMSVVDGDGKLVRADGNKKDPVSWARAWELETQHYHVTSHVSPAKLFEYGSFLEAIYKSYIKVYAPDAIPPYKMEVHIFNTQRDFMSAAASHGFPVGGSVGGFFVPSLLSIYAFEVMPEGFSLTLNRVLAHECSHQFLHCTCNGSENVPTWINEGLAVYFESGIFQNGVFNIQMPKDRIQLLQELYGQFKHTLSPLDQYLDHHGHISGEAYGEVFAMTHFWIFGACKGPGCPHTGCGLFRFRQFWNALKKGEDGNTAFERIFMADMIKAKGGREEAIAAWTQALMDYVMHTLK